MKLTLTPAAAKALRQMPKTDAAALVEKLETLAAAPFATYPWAKRLVGTKSFRVRQGDWRAIYTVDRATQEVVVIGIANRREVYR